MGARVCGASAERDALSASRCWCRGLFCYRGGHKRTVQFRHAVRLGATASSRAEFEELLKQRDLFSMDAAREEWIARLEAHAPAGKERRGRDGDIRRAV